MVLGIQPWNQFRGSERPGGLGAAKAGVPLAGSLQGPSFTLTQVPSPGYTEDPGPKNQLYLAAQKCKHWGRHTPEEE